MRNTLFMCVCVLLVLTFQFCYAGSSGGHLIKITIQHHPNCKPDDTDVGSVNQDNSQTSLDSFTHYKKQQTKSISVSFGLKGSNVHLKWQEQDNLSPEQLKEVQDKIHYFLADAEKSRHQLSSYLDSSDDSNPVFYWTITDAI